MATYHPPANARDFDLSAQLRDELYMNWDAKIRAYVLGSEKDGDPLVSYPAFFEPIAPPANLDASVAKPSWPGFPGAARRLYSGTLAAIASKIDGPVLHGDTDPLLERPAPIIDPDSGLRFEGAWYRPQDEYLEWAVRRGASGAISEVVFTSEGPEYWREMARVDFELVVSLYRALTGDPSVSRAQLEFPKDVVQFVRRGNQVQVLERFAKGDYNPYNRLNRDFAIHLTQRANTLGAEIRLAKDASRLYGSPVVTTDPRLICCAGYGEPNRNSDPTIGAAVNAAVRNLQKRVSLVDPVGLYIRDWRWDQITCDGKAFPDAQRLFEVIRGDLASQRILRLLFRVPAGLQFDGSPVTLGRLQIGGEPISTGGQIASLINVHLFASTAPGAPAQTPVPCSGKPCFAKGHPQYIIPIEPSEQCAASGVDIGIMVVGAIPGLAIVERPADTARLNALELTSAAADGPAVRARRW